MTVAERDAVLEMFNALLRVTFKVAGDSDKVTLLAQWRESYDVLCAERCSADPPT